MNMQTKMVALALALAPLSASAFEYNYAQGSFVDNDFDSGIMVEGSYDVTDLASVQGYYFSTGDFSGFSIGGSYRLNDMVSVPEGSSLSGHVAFESAKFDCSATVFGVTVDCGSFDDTGIAFGGLYQYQLQDNLELFGDLTYTTIYDGDFQITGGAKFDFAENLSVVGSYTISDADLLKIGVRYTFPK